MEAVFVTTDGVLEPTQISHDATKGIKCNASDDWFSPIRQVRFTARKQSCRFDLLICEPLKNKTSAPPHLLKVGPSNDETVHALAVTVVLPVILVRFGAGMLVPLRLEDFGLQQKKRSGGRHRGSTVDSQRSAKRQQRQSLPHQQSQEETGTIDLSSMPDTLEHNDHESTAGGAMDVSSTESNGETTDNGSDDEEDDCDESDNDDASDMTDFSEFSEASGGGGADDDEF